MIPTYSTNPEDIITKIMTVFDDGLEILQKIPQLEPILMKHLFRTHTKKMLKAPIRPRQKPSPPDPEKKSVLPDENTWLWENYDSIKQALTESIQPLYEYVQTFEQFKAENDLVPDKYVSNLDEGDGSAEGGITADELKLDIQRIKELERNLMERIPESVVVSIFRINIKDIRNLYQGKYQQIVDKEIKLIAARATDKNYAISTKFGEINERIQRVPKDIEELTETKKYISEIGIVIEKQRKEIDICMGIYDICDEFGYELSSTENDNKWKLFGAPIMIMETIQNQTIVLEKQREAFIKEMELEQEEFEETLDGLAVTVTGFDAFNDVGKYLEIAENVVSMNERLQECLDKSRKFNSREFLVGKDQRDYGRLGVMTKEFKPYSDLWLTTRTWYQRHEAWTAGEWDALDPEELEETFETCFKTITASARVFKTQGDKPKILNIANGLKGKIDDFKPIVPVAVSLRKKGMVDRHWDELSKGVGFDIRPVEGFTLNSVIEKGLVEHSQVCEDVGEKAFKEFGIEQSLAKMLTEWEGSNFALPEFKSTGTCYISAFDEAVQRLDEHIVNTQAMQFSPFKKPFEEQIE